MRHFVKTPESLKKEKIYFVVATMMFDTSKEETASIAANSEGRASILAHEIFDNPYKIAIYGKEEAYKKNKLPLKTWFSKKAEKDLNKTSVLHCVMM